MKTEYEVENLFEDVRKSYRLLALYQRRILDLVKEISLFFNYGVHPSMWAKYSALSPRDGARNINRWSWDWLNMYCYEFHLGSFQDEKSEALYAVSVIHIPDTGWFDSELKLEERGEVCIPKFKAIAESKSLFLFIASKNQHEWWEPDLSTFADILRNPVFNLNMEIDTEMYAAKALSLANFINQQYIEESCNRIKDFFITKGILIPEKPQMD